MKAAAQAVVRTRSLPGLLFALVLAVLAVLAAGARPVSATTNTTSTTSTPSATSVSAIGQALRKSPVYVDPAAAAQLSAKDADALADRITKADKPLFVAVLPADYPKQDLFTKLRTATGITGLYAVRLGDAFDARADASVLPGAAVRNLVTTVQGEDTRAQLTDFTAAALTNMGGSAPSTWQTSDDGGGVSSTALITVGAVLVAGGAGAYTLVRRNRRRHAEEQRAALEKLRVVVDEDITAFGEELDRLDFHPAEAGADDAMRADYERALDAYEQAKSLMGAATRPEDVRAVTGPWRTAASRWPSSRRAVRAGPFPSAGSPASSTPATVPPSPTPPGRRRAGPRARSRSAPPTPPACPTAGTR